MSKKSGKTGAFLGGFIMGLASVAGGYFAYKLVKPDYLKDYEEDDDFDDFDDIDDLDDFDDLEEEDPIIEKYPEE